MAQLSLDHVVVRVNDALCGLARQSERELLGRTAAALGLVPDGWAPQAAAGEVAGQLLTLTGVPVQVRTAWSLVRDEHGRPTSVHLVVVDDSVRLQTAIVETAAEGIWAVRRDGTTLQANARVAEILGRPLEEVYARPAVELLNEEQARRLRERLEGRTRVDVERYEVAYDHPVDGPRVLAVAARPLQASDGTVESSLAMISDVTEARRGEEELRHAALHDPLTGLPNRSLLLDRLEHALARQTTATAVILLDLDHFKVVNDSRGHAVGDQLLVAVAQRLLAAARPADTVARFGGDEFVVVCEDVDETEAERLAMQLVAALQGPIALDQGSTHVRASLGIALSPPNDAADLLRFADAAMYSAKEAGRGRVRRFDRSLADQAEERFALAADLRAALAAGALTLHYQPVVELETGRLLGLEALTRWEHPVHGSVPPSTFVPVAERSGLAGDLDTWVLHRALSEFAALRSSGAVPHDATISVNLSASHLSDPDLEPQVVAAVRAADVDPGLVVLEITEGAIMNDADTAVDLLRRLRTRGFLLAIDDFGTGYSSLAYLRRLPVTSLKVDQSFVSHICEDSDALAIIASIVDLARAVDVSVVAEGVETAEQASLLRQVGCQAGQGWLWGPAVPPDEVAAIRDWDGRDPAHRRRGRLVVGVEHGRNELLSLHRQGASPATIAAALNRAGYRSPGGPRWHASSVARALAD